MGGDSQPAASRLEVWYLLKYPTVHRQGEVTEWLMVLVLKTSVGQLTASSNLALSAIENRGRLASVFYGEIGAQFELVTNSSQMSQHQRRLHR